jgi:benzoate/toluate 1,2-dioxygenase reductase component
MRIVTVPIADIAVATPRSRLVRLDMREQSFTFEPGHAVMVGHHGQSERRPYSIASSPEQAAETQQIELLISVEQNGNLGSNLEPAAPGTLVDVEGPIGVFTLPPVRHDGWLLFVAGGTGIAPLRAMLDHTLRRPPGPRISMLYSARRGDEFAFVDELVRHAKAGRLELHQTVTRDESTAWSGRRGRIGRSHFEAVLHDPGGTLCVVCGPEPLVNESVGTLKALGVPDTQIRTEQWGR